MPPAQSSGVSMEVLRGAPDSLPDKSSTEAEPASSAAVCCCRTQWWRCLKSLLPLGFWNEAFQLLKIAGPVVRLETIAGPS